MMVRSQKNHKVHKAVNELLEVDGGDVKMKHSKPTSAEKSAVKKVKMAK